MSSSQPVNLPGAWPLMKPLLEELNSGLLNTNLSSGKEENLNLCPLGYQCLSLWATLPLFIALSCHDFLKWQASC